MARQTRTANAAIIGSAAVDANRYRVTIAANEEARQPPTLDFEGLSVDNYMLNPVVMWAHDVSGRSPSGGLPIGRTLELAKTGAGRLVAEFEFLGDDPFARRVKNAWDRGFLRAASISWLPIETSPTRDGGYRDTRSDLLEWSISSPSRRTRTPCASATRGCWMIFWVWQARRWGNNRPPAERPRSPAKTSSRSGSCWRTSS